VEESRKEPWMNWLALTTVMLAVCATLSTFKGGSYSSRSMMSQIRAANAWSYYQSKSIKGYLYEIRKEELEMALQEAGPAASRSAAALNRAKIAEYGKRIERYDAEKAGIQKEAKDLEAVRDDSQKHARIFGMAVIFLQVAILLSSIAALLKRKPVWILGLVIGAAGVFYFIDGFLLFLN
jgi:hypothetical protein